MGGCLNIINLVKILNFGNHKITIFQFSTIFCLVRLVFKNNKMVSMATVLLRQGWFYTISDTDFTTLSDMFPPKCCVHFWINVVKIYPNFWLQSRLHTHTHTNEHIFVILKWEDIACFAASSKRRMSSLRVTYLVCCSTLCKWETII